MLGRSNEGILINEKAIKVHLDKEKITKKMELLQKRMVIAYFVGGRILPSVLQKWVSFLSKEIGEDCKIGKEQGFDIFQIVMREEAAM